MFPFSSLFGEFDQFDSHSDGLKPSTRFSIYHEPPKP